MAYPNNAAIKPRRKIITNDFRMAAPKSDKPVPGAKYPATPMFDLANNGEILFKVNDSLYGEGIKRKEFKFKRYLRDVFFEEIVRCALDRKYVPARIDIPGSEFGMGGQKLDKPMSAGKLVIGRDKDNHVYFAYIKGDYSVKFIFRSPYEALLESKTEEGFTIDTVRMSEVFAKKWAESNMQYLDDLEVENFVPYESKKKEGSNTNSSAEPSVGDDDDEW